jgi:hypothetical protein
MRHLKFSHLIHMFQSSHYCSAIEGQKCDQSTIFILWKEKKKRKEKKSEENLTNEVLIAVAMNSAVLWDETPI